MSGDGGASVIVLPFWAGGPPIAVEFAQNLLSFFDAAGGEWEALGSFAGGAPRDTRLRFSAKSATEAALDARFEKVVFFSPDSGIPPKEILRVLKPLGPSDAVWGTRYGHGSIRQGKMGFYLIQECAAAIALHLRGAPVSDAASGLVATKKIAIPQTGGSSLPAFARSLQAEGGKVTEASVMWIARRPKAYSYLRRFGWGEARS